MTIVANSTYFEWIDVYAHNKNQMYLPNLSKIYGSSRITKPVNHSSYYVLAELTKTELRSLDSPGNI